MIRTRRFRAFLAMLLAFCLVSASLWSVSADAVADALSVEAGFHNIDNDNGHTPVNKPCNDGCHAQSQLTGFDSSNASFAIPMSKEAPRGDHLPAISGPAPDILFRPPRSTVQA